MTVAPTSCSSEGKTVAVFQLESTGMQRMLKDAKPSVFEDIIALVALYRPGPMDLIPSFCARKHGKEAVEYPHPLMKEVLEETYGIMVYQEQVMQVAQRLGGYSLGGADLLRRAMGKKKLEEMVKHRAIFAEGAATNGIAEPLANEIFDLMEKFAGYGFNKSHAAAYALLAYHTAWLKVHYLAEFTAANMSVALDDTDKLKIFHDDAVALGITFEPPNVNTGTHRFEPVSDKVVRYGLGAIKGTGQSAIEAIVQARTEGGPFKSLFDFCARVDRSRINKRTIEALIKAGAFDLLHPERSVAVASIALAFDYADTQAAHADQGGLFDFGDSHAASTQEPELVQAAPWSIKERLGFEKIALGFYLSGHLFDQSGDEVRRFARRKIADLLDSREPQVLAGIVGDLRVINGMRGRGRDLQARRQERGHRGRGQRGDPERQQGPAEGRRAHHRLRQGAARPLLRRHAAERAAGVGPADGALPLRQVPAGGGQRQRAAGGRGAARLPVAPRADARGHDHAGPGGAAGAAARIGRGRTRPGRGGAILPE